MFFLIKNKVYKLITVVTIVHNSVVCIDIRLKWLVSLPCQSAMTMGPIMLFLKKN